MEYSLDLIRKKSKETILKDDSIKNFYETIYWHISKEAESGAVSIDYFIEYKSENIHNVRNICKLFRLDGFEVNMNPSSAGIFINIVWAKDNDIYI